MLFSFLLPSYIQDNSLILMVGGIYIQDKLSDVTSSLISDKIAWTFSKSLSLLFRLLLAWTHSWHHLHNKIMSDQSSDSFLFHLKLDLIWCTSTQTLLSHLSQRHTSQACFLLVLYRILIWFSINQKILWYKSKVLLSSLLHYLVYIVLAIHCNSTMITFFYQKI